MGELASGTVFAGHRIDSVAGRGGMGVVYRATQLALDRTVALKVIAPGLLEDENVRQRFVRESKVAASIEHPNVIPIYYAGEEEGIAFIAMRYVPGDDVRSLVRRVGYLAPERAARIVSQIAAALDAAHAAGLVHRDIKPANVLLGPDEHVYLTDFGLTKHALSIAGSTKPGHWVGTLDYVAPEQIRGERVDARADVYALGCLLYYTLTGEVPFPAEGDEAKLWAHLSLPAPRPSEHAPGLPVEFDAVVERALAKDPDDRYQSAGDLGRAAVAAAAGRAPDVPEHLVATGAAAPIESETLSAARPVLAEPLEAVATADAVTVRERHTRLRRARRPALGLAALVLAAAAGVAVALALGLGGSDNKEGPLPRASAQPTPPANGLKVAREITVHGRPNVVGVEGGKIFVGSFASKRMTLVTPAAGGTVLPYQPEVGTGVNAIASGEGAVWAAITRDHQVVRLSATTGHVTGAPIKLPGRPAAIAVDDDAVWVGMIVGHGRPDQLVKLDAKTGKTLLSVPYPYGIMALTTSPGAVWALNRRRARVQRADPKTGEVEHSLQVGSTHGESIAYDDGRLWIATPGDDTVYAVDTGTGSAIPIGVGRRPRDLVVANDHVYVTNYNSSDLYTIDEKTLRVVGKPLNLPVNPSAIDWGDGSLWIVSQPESKLTRVAVTNRGA